MTGTAVDYLIRYASKKNRLVFRRTIAFQTIDAELRAGAFGASNFYYSLAALGTIACRYLDGRSACAHKAAYAATALSIIDNYYRSAKMPNTYYSSVFGTGRSQSIRDHLHDYCFEPRHVHKRTVAWFNGYFDDLGGRSFADNISKILRLFYKNIQNKSGALWKAKFLVLNSTLANSSLVGGADFDCIIEHDGNSILTDIKTTIKPLQIKHIYQLIGYVLLHDPKKDPFKITHAGIYYSRSGSFEYISLDKLIGEVLLNSWTVTHARKRFIKHIGEFSPGYW